MFIIIRRIFQASLLSGELYRKEYGCHTGRKAGEKRGLGRGKEKES